MTSLIMHIVTLHGSKVTDLITEGLSLLMCTKAFNSSDLVLNFSAYPRGFKDSSPKDFCEVTSMTK
jgi:hypothetical protein